MNIITFQKLLSSYEIFSLKDIRKVIPDFSYRQLNRWENKGYIRRIKRGEYVFTDYELSESLLFLIANKIYKPSYISLETALKFYDLIPEEVFQTTSVSTKKTTNFNTFIGNFNYRHIQPSLFFGYKLLVFKKQNIIIADVEKAILDYLYLHSHLKTIADFESIRFNKDAFIRQVDLSKFQMYLKTFQNKSLTKRTQTFLTLFQND